MGINSRAICLALCAMAAVTFSFSAAAQSGSTSKSSGAGAKASSPSSAKPTSSSGKTTAGSSKAPAASAKDSAKTKASSSDEKNDDSSSNKKKSQTDNSPATSSASVIPAISAEANRPIDPRAFDEVLLSRLIFDFTNVERSRQNMPRFDHNQYLQSAAVAHSRDMASRSYFNHKSKGIFRRTSHSDRIASTGYRPRTSAENIAMIPTFNSQRIQSYGAGQQVVDTDYNSYHRMAVYAVQQWMNSPGHRQNILNRSFTDLGIGVAVGMQGNIPYVYLTQNFGG